MTGAKPSCGSPVFIDGKSPPAKNHAAWRNLAFGLNRMKQIADGSSGPWREDQERLTRIIDAITTLNIELPLTRPQYLEDIAMGRHPNFVQVPGGEDYLKGATVRLGALDELIEAVGNAMVNGIPVAPAEVAFAPKIESNLKWHDIDVQLERIFHAAMPGRSKATAYRFIEKVIPELTGENATLGTIQKHLKSLHSVNREK